MRALLGGCLLSGLLAAMPAFAQAPKSEEKVTLRVIMQQIALEYVDAAKALMIDDFKTLEAAGRAIEHHPLPDAIIAAIKSKLGDNFAGFEKVDERSHAAAHSLSTQAAAKNSAGTAMAFGELSAACVSCHAQFGPTLRPLAD
jgi:cytochrome c556